MSKLIAYVGTYTQPILFGTGQILEGKGKGIYGYSFDTETGEMLPLFVQEGVENPSFLTLSNDGKHLYAVNEMKEFQGQMSGTVSAFRVEKDHTLRFLNQRATGGTDPCHVITDENDRNVFVANYSSGSAIMIPVESDGSLAERADLHQHEGCSVNKDRQAGPHAHSVIITPDGKRAIVVDLGIDKLTVYHLDAENGTMTPDDTASFATIPGSGPRFGVFHPNGKYFYYICELSQQIGFLIYDAEYGTFTQKQVVPTVVEPFEGEPSSADIHITPDGKYVYGSVRGCNTLVGYRVLDDGLLEHIGTFPCGGKIPRNFCIDPTGQFVVVANQDTDNLCVFRINPESGELTQVFEAAAPTPVCIRIYPITVE